MTTNRVRELTIWRRLTGMSLERLAVGTGIAATRLWRIEHGIVTPSDAELEACRRAFLATATDFSADAMAALSWLSERTVEEPATL